jgi:hypothetical protein
MFTTRRQALAFGGLGLAGVGAPTLPSSAERLDVRDYGAKGDWNPYTLTGTDDTSAIRAAIAACPMGGTVFFPGTGPNRKYLISGQIDITTPNIRVLGAPRDTYATSIRCNTVNTVMFMVKTTGVVFQDVGIEGGGGAITGVEVWGDADGNCDSRFDGVTFMRLLVGARTRGRNNTFLGACIFSISTEGVVIDGPVPGYHTGVHAYASMRGNKVTDCSFHGNGSSAVHGCVHIMPAARVLYAVISNNSFDGSGKGTHILAEGTTNNPVQHLHMSDNTHMVMGRKAYDLSYVHNSSINGASIEGMTGSTYFSDHGIRLANCSVVTISDVFGHNIGRTGLVATGCSTVQVRDVTLNRVGLDTGANYHGFDVNSTNTGFRLDNVTVISSPGFGITGDPIDSSMTGAEFRSCMLGTINSATLLNRGMRGRNAFIEGSGGRKQDYASKSFDILVASGATNVATVTAAHPLTSFMVEVEIIGRNAGGNCFIKAVRYVRPENGKPAFTTVGSDTATGTIAVGFITSGVNGINVTATAIAQDDSVTVHVTASAGGGVAANARGVTVTML